MNWPPRAGGRIQVSRDIIEPGHGVALAAGSYSVTYWDVDGDSEFVDDAGDVGDVWDPNSLTVWLNREAVTILSGDL